MLRETPVIDGYIRWLQSLSIQASHRVSQFVTADTRMRTPECECTGLAAIGQLHAELFDDAQKLIIRVTDHAQGQDGHTVYLRWDRLITNPSGQKQTLSGITEIMLGLDGKIASIIEYWDSVPEPLKKRGYFTKLFGR